MIKDSREGLEMRCFITGAGEFSGLVIPGSEDFIIAADGGYRELVSRGIVPDLVVGDFDSLGSPPDHPHIFSSPVEKDDTDMMLAVKQGLSRGYKLFLIDGGLGGRLDHTIANCQTLAYLSRNGARGVLLGREMRVTAVTNGTVRFAPGDADSAGAPDGTPAGIVSVFSAGEKAEGVTITGLKYPLEDAALTCDYPLGVSNEFTGSPAEVTVREGTLLIAWTGEYES